MRSLRFRLHEWLADHVKWVQYPRQQYIPTAQVPARPRRPFFKYQMEWWQRLTLFYAGLLAIIFGLAFLAVGGAIFYMVLVAIFTT